MRKIPALFIYYSGAFVSRESGSHTRVIELLDFAQRISENVTLYSYTDHPESSWSEGAIERFRIEFPHISLVMDKRSFVMIALSKIKVFLISLFPSLAAPLIRLRIPGATPNYRRKIAADVIIVNYASGVLELNGLRARTWVIDTHDVQFINFARRTKRRFSDLKVTLKARSEIEIVRQSTATLAISAQEASLFRLLVPETRVFFIPTFLTQIRPSRRDKQRFDYDLAFVGSQNQFNIDGLYEFIITHRKWLSSKRIAIAGRVCESPRIIQETRGMSNVELLGYVDDIDAFLACCKAVISPVGGTGLKIKLLDAFRAGKPVFTNSESLAALPNGYQGCAFLIDEKRMDRLISEDRIRLAAEMESTKYAERLNDASDINAFIELLQFRSQTSASRSMTSFVSRHIARVQE